MTKMLDEALETVRRLPPATQDAIAQAMMALASADEPEEIAPEHIQDVLEGLAQARRREFATDEDVAVAFRRFRP